MGIKYGSSLVNRIVDWPTLSKPYYTFLLNWQCSLVALIKATFKQSYVPTGKLDHDVHSIICTLAIFQAISNVGQAIET